MSTIGGPDGGPDTSRSDSQPPPYARTCVCGRAFFQPNAFSTHERSCSRIKKRLSGALTKAKELWDSRKRRRVLSEPVVDSESNQDGPPAARIHSEACAVAFSPDEVPHSAENTNLNNPVNADPSTAQHDLDTSGLSLAVRRPRRVNRQLPKRFRDILPQKLPALPPPAADSVPSDAEAVLQPTSRTAITSPASDRRSVNATPRLRRILETTRNVFGLFRRYEGGEVPQHDPEDYVTSTDFSNVFSAPARCFSNSDSKGSFGPYPNQSSFRLGEWYWNGPSAQKSQASFKELLDIIHDPDFHSEDTKDINWRKLDQQLADGDSADGWVDSDGANWERTPITLSVPFPKKSRDPGVRDFLFGDFYHRSITSIIREKISNHHDCQRFHFEPYSLHWQRHDRTGAVQDPIQVHGELYTSPAFIDAHKEVQDLPGEPGCNMPRVVVALQFWSDSTHLTSFGNAKLWPLYLWFGNESKYRRCKPSYHLCNHVAYFQPLPDTFKDFAAEHTGGKGPTPEFMTHCHREFLHAQWSALLDSEFLEAYEHGIVITCFDGIKRRFYPRFFTYSADYPEKILFACIRNRGGCPCPRCLIPLSRVHNLGMTRDMEQRRTLARVDDIHRRNAILNARKLIYEKGWAVDSAPVERILKPESLVPTTNAFSETLTPLGTNIFAMFVVDLLHEFEIGVWKTFFIHLLRILEASKEGLLHELDRRYRLVPSFGNSTIRRFSRNSSELKQMAARDFEDLLQCAIPVFEGLLPGTHNEHVIQILFMLAHWHALAKLRMHTDSTLALLDRATVSLGAALRHFQTTVCPAFKTRELKREAEARKRHTSSRKNSRQTEPRPSTNAGTNAGTPANDGPSTNALDHPSGSNGKQPEVEPGPSARRPKVLNLQTYKLHALGDYADCIRRYGTTDSYSTEPGELEHRRPKRWYTRTSRKQYVKQITKIERRQARIRHIREQLGNQVTRDARGDESDSMAHSPEVHHVIGSSQNIPCNIPSFMQKYVDDPAIKAFLPRLKKHLLPRIRAALRSEATEIDRLQSYDPQAETPSEDDWRFVFFKNEVIHEHKLMRINYTTYDVRRAQDVINPSTTHNNIMTLATTAPDAPECFPSQHPFRYARVVGIFHANVIFTGPGTPDYNTRHLEFLWVRWYEIEEESAGWDASRLDRVRFLPMADEDAFGFLDPKDVLRGCHVIPAFACGKLHADGISISRCVDDSQDSKYYYVNRFVDRDMVMQYHLGQGVGHVHTTPDFSENSSSSCHVISTDEEHETLGGNESRKRNLF
ncbi:hypothetical protein BV22DRAFT_1134671 [Leucogyrophana mollusca]|uniref:Uncharacterized protein n=1 Tax=Leucogyrophana mollusca TaxID=85980 RepID=A0ACB8AXS6_9AGAM|nr:hypothetical protein BV22DRAFT_1134671 [Leucogyrophana mollusca]